MHTQRWNKTWQNKKRRNSVPRYFILIDKYEHALVNWNEQVQNLIAILSLTHSLCVSLLYRSWPWFTSTVTNVWTRPARRTVRCPVSETAHTRAPNSGYSAMSHYQRSSDQTLHTRKYTHSHTRRPRRRNQGKGQCFLKLGTRKRKTSREGIQEDIRTAWTALPLPQIRGRSMFDPPQSETHGDDGCCFLFAFFVFSKRF